MSTLFSPSVINGMEIANRFVRSATWEGMATPEGKSTDRLTGVMAALAEGGVGLIISGHCYVSPEGQAGPWQLGLCDEAALPELTHMTATVHRLGGKIALQLAHAGARGNTKITGLQAIGPSVVYKDGAALCREMTRDDIARLAQAFAQAAAWARQAGFDAVQLHAAHGYGLSQFLSPLTNRRTDEYGGSLPNRGRAVLEVFQAVRQAVGRDYPVMIKLNSEDFIEGGFSVEDMLEVSALLEQAGMDAIEMSGSTLNEASKYLVSRVGPVSPENEGYYREAARRFKQSLKVPLMLVGGIRSLEGAERLLAEGTADYIALCRPLICEPDLVNRWKRGETAKSLCLSDNSCFRPAFAGEGMRCPVREKGNLAASGKGV
jgi:2,4-dienoyl-CoA reductase-like NADH-dependent reductase (Old Yellow Enzyme family)